MNTPHTSETTDKAQIQNVIDQWRDAFLARDTDAVMALYLPDAMVFDAIPPHRISGVDMYRKTWEACMPYFSAPFTLEWRKVEIEVSGDLATSHSEYRILGLEEQTEMTRAWLRNTTIYRRVAGGWKIMHEHTSVPFNPETNQAEFLIEWD